MNNVLLAEQVRQRFLDFFRRKGHHIAEPAPLVVKGDSTLLFTNAGMNPFKDIFLGFAQAAHPRVADTQPCLRVSGKHNDLEDVGHDTYHHTLFEMLGNWSFGDYFKEEAIAWAWELLTVEFKLDPDRLYVTVFGGDQGDGLEYDHEARSHWSKWIDSSRILPGSRKDNFWEMGDQGPCGPCSEIHIDLRSDLDRATEDGALLVNNDHPQVLEIWNLVFMEFNRMADGRLERLPQKHVDTGMGFERLCRALVGASSNYDTGVFLPLIEAIERGTGMVYGKSEPTDIAIRVVADHIRAVSFVIADGQLPSNTGAGYVCRRILRRAVRYGYTFLGRTEPFLHLLVPVLSAQMGGMFPRLNSQLQTICDIIKQEELTFLRTLSTGLLRLDQLMKDAKASTASELSGQQVFELFDTYGFPADLTALIAREKGFAIDEGGFEQAMQEQKNRSRRATRQQAGDWIRLGDDSSGSVFTGYHQTEQSTSILAARQVEKAGQQRVQLILTGTPFYAESGGQVGDTGVLIHESGHTIPVLDTIKENGQIMHIVEQMPGELEGNWTAKVDASRRQLISVHHSATHLLHAALRQVLGTHVQQKGSLVGPESLRFDFSHGAPLSDDEARKVGEIVNQRILQAIDLKEETGVSLEEATARGAMALFGEKYGETVRVITFDPEFSVELCGGTHIQNTAKIGSFFVTAETGVAAGVRRIEAVGGHAAHRFVSDRMAQWQQIHETLRSPRNLPEQVQRLQQELASMRKELERRNDQALSGIQKELSTQYAEYSGMRILMKVVDLDQVEHLKKLAGGLVNQSGLSAVVLGAIHSEKASIAIAMNPTLSGLAGLTSGSLAKEAGAILGGSGGGSPQLAMAGGPEKAKLSEALKYVNEQLLAHINAQ